MMINKAYATSSQKIGFRSKIHEKEIRSALVKDALYELSKAIKKIRSPLLSIPPVEDEEFEEEDFVYPRSEGIEINIPSNIIDIYTRLEFLL